MGASGKSEKELFEQYRAAKAELAQIEYELHRYHRVADSVKGSMTEPPYITHVIQIEGTDIAIDLDVIKILEMRRRELKQMRLDMEVCLSKIDDCQLAAILRARYVEGMSWQAVTMRMGGYNSVSGVKMRVTRYFRSQL